MNAVEYKVRFDFFNLPKKLLPSNCGAYIITHTASGQIYIGSSGDLVRRMRVHRLRFSKGLHENKRLQIAYDSDRRFSVMFHMTPDRETAYCKEQELLDLYVKSGAEVTNVSMDVRISGLGHEVTPEHREILKTLRTGKKASQTTVDKQRSATIKRMKDPTVRANLREKAKQQWSSPEAREVMSRLHLGRKHTEEAKQNMLDSRKHLFKPIVINGVTYGNCKEASRALNISYSTIKHRCQSTSDAFKEWYFDEESHGPEKIKT